MRKFIAVLVAVFGFSTGLVVLAPAQASGPVHTTVTVSSKIPCDKMKMCKAPDVQATPDSTDAAATGWAMGGYPNYWTICAVDAVGGGTWSVLARNWTWPYHELNLIVGNRCDGYSITNRFTFNYQNSATESCGKILNGHKTWSPARGRYIWDAGPILIVNINDKCTNDPVSYDHQVQEYIGWLLGLQPDPQDCDCVMGNTLQDRDTIRYVVGHDILDMDVVYRH